MINIISETHGLTVQHISDTHGRHYDINIDLNADILIHSGDESNHRVPALNNAEWEDFIEWYSQVPVPVKIFVPGNHSATCATEERRCRKQCRDLGITYLNKETVSIYGLNIYGDPTTPSFGQWYFMARRDKINKHWELIPQDTHILITHGPPQGILDTVVDSDIRLVGDSALYKRIQKLPELKLHCFGHVHDSKSAMNTGVRVQNDITFSNAAAVQDGKMSEGIKFHGNKFKF